MLLPSVLTSCQECSVVSLVNKLYVFFFMPLCSDDAIMSTVPRVFTVWWLVWNELNPVSFPLPDYLHHFPTLQILLRGDNYDLTSVATAWLAKPRLQ